MYNRILVPLDGSKLAESVFPHVEAMVKAFKPESITFLRVVEPHIPHVEADAIISDKEERDLEAQYHAEAREYLENLIKQIGWSKVGIKSEVLPSGQIAERIINFARNNKMDLIILASHGRSGMVHWFLGSVAEKILRSSSTPVLIIRVAGPSSRLLRV